MKKNFEYDGKWFTFYLTRDLELDFSFEICGYFDNRPRIRIKPFLFNLTLILPIRNKWTDECDPPKWGIAYHNQIFCIYRGGKGNMKGGNKWWTFHMPWSFTWVRTSALRKEGTWEHETSHKNSKNFWDDKWKDILWNETYPYTYVLKSGEVQHRKATVKIEEREWRRRWLKWTSLGNSIKRTISVNFNDEVGEETGSWKGGTIGCGYNLLPNEKPLDCLRRMEKERKF